MAISADESIIITATYMKGGKIKIEDQHGRKFQAEGYNRFGDRNMEVSIDVPTYPGVPGDDRPTCEITLRVPLFVEGE